MATLKEFEKEIEKIKTRNKNVENDKAWEISLTRRGILTLFTYLAIGFYLQAIGIPMPWLNAIVPAVAFMLSTLTLPLFKKLWLRYIHKK
jgi:sterol desaturase/sphingolipid hydroxylase (fatty acid hydroxylase superfamily)